MIHSCSSILPDPHPHPTNHRKIHPSSHHQVTRWASSSVPPWVEPSVAGASPCPATSPLPWVASWTDGAGWSRAPLLKGGTSARAHMKCRTCTWTFDSIDYHRISKLCGQRVVWNTPPSGPRSVTCWGFYSLVLGWFWTPVQWVDMSGPWAPPSSIGTAGLGAWFLVLSRQWELSSVSGSAGAVRAKKWLEK